MKYSFYLLALSTCFCLIWLGVVGCSKEVLTNTSLDDDIDVQLVNNAERENPKPKFNFIANSRVIRFRLSSDNRTLIFSANGVGGSGIFTWEIGSPSTTRLIDSEAMELSPAFSNSGKTITYSVIEKGGARIYLADLSASFDQKNATVVRNRSITQLSEGDAEFFDADPVFSTDGARIFFMRAHRNREYSLGGRTWDNWDLYCYDVLQDKSSRITYGNFHAVSPPQISQRDQIVFAYKHMDDRTYRMQSRMCIFAGSKNEEIHSDFGVSFPIFGKAELGEEVISVSDREVEFEYEILMSQTNLLQVNQLTNERSYLLLPQMTSDGKAVFFLKDPDRNGAYELWKGNFRRSGLENIERVADARLFISPQ